MSTSAWISLCVTLAVFAALQLRRRVSADLLFLGGLVVVTLLGVIPPEDAVAGFANPAVLMIGSLFVVAAALRATGVLDWIGNQLLGTARTAGQALVRLSIAVVSISAFINNTPVVAMLVPVVLDWCRKRGVSPSRLLIPVSYFAILGGTCTMIGTSTNIVINGLLAKSQVVNAQRPAAEQYSPEFRAALKEMTLLEIGQVGLPCAMLGLVYLLTVGRRLLPDRSELVEQLGEQRREYTVEMLVQPTCRLIGKTVEQAGLRHLRGLFLIEIDRDDEVITPVTPRDTIRAGDRLIFTGVVTTIVDLVRIPGLVPAADITYEITATGPRPRRLSEAVISRSSPLIGTTVRAANFRQLYNAAVVAVHRNGARLRGKVGDVVVQAGDTLLLQTRTEFASHYRHSPDFYLVADVEGSQPRRHDRALLALLLVGVLIAWLGATSFLGREGMLGGLASPAVAAVTVAGLMVFFRCLPIGEARSSIDLQVLITVAAALGLGRALTDSGAAEAVAGVLVDSVGRGHPYLLLAVLYLLSLVFTELITNTAVAIMLFPVGVAMAAAAGLSPRPFIMAIAVAASLSFITPIGYQTNLMVLGPGGYQPRDYMRIGWPLVALMTVTALVLIPIVWPFEL
jgi:di/tricarboxylate transporter